MNKETEIRIKLNKELESKIRELSDNWKKKVQVDDYYRGDFNGCLLRLRKEDGDIVFCCKYFNKDKTWNEIEFEIKEEIKLKKILQLIANKHFQISKVRETAKIKHKGKDIEVNIDRIKGLGLYCEFEVINMDRSFLIDFLNEKGIKGQIIKKGYVQLVENEQKKV